MEYKKIIAELVNEKINLGVEEIIKLIEIPEDITMGDFALPCFRAAKALRKSPMEIAANLAAEVKSEHFVKIENKGGYLNFFIDQAAAIKSALDKILAEKDNYGKSEIGKGQNIIVEYSSPNIAKPFHIGHLSTTVLGSSLYKLFKSQGYNTIAINHLGDWGTQFGQLVYAYKTWVDEKALEEDGLNELLRIYIKFHEEAEKDPSLQEKARMHFKNLEDGCEEEKNIWKLSIDVTIKALNKTYNRLNAEFDSYAGESFYNDKMDAVIKELKEKELMVESNGAMVVKLDEYNMPPCIILKSDGATIYATRDLAAAKYRKQTYDFVKNIYVVALNQELHFRQVFTTLKKMGYDWAENCVHVGFGLVFNGDKKFATRKGEVVFLEDVLDESVKRTLEIIQEKNPELENKEYAAEKIGIGAVIFTFLKNKKEKDIHFYFDEMLNFDGETGPYVQYAYVRGKSILKKTGGVKGAADYSKLTTLEEYDLVKTIAKFNAIILDAIDKYEPSILTKYLIEVTKAFNKFYNTCPINSCEDEGMKNARLNLVEAAAITIKNGLALLGIDTVEQM